MNAISIQGKLCCLFYRGQRDIPINMRKQFPAARFLPDQSFVQLGLVHMQQNKICFASTVTAGAFFNLAGGGQMQESIGAICWIPSINPGALRHRPGIMFGEVIYHSDRRIWCDSHQRNQMRKTMK